MTALDRARGHGFQVLVARAASAESVLAYAALADLLSEVDAPAWADLPDPQRIAVDRIMLHGDETDPATDQRAVAAGFLAVVERIMKKTPLILAIDDLQWLDPSSVRVVGFAARRLSGRVGVLATVRTGPDIEANASWLQMLRPDAIRRIRVTPLTLGEVNQMVSRRFGRAFPRPTMVRIHEVSGGNPFYALELARAIDTAEPGSETVLPDTLTELVRARVGSLELVVRQVLLAAACMATPTVEQVAKATGEGAERVIGLLEEAEDKGIVGIDGHLVRFSHPMLARGIYTGAATGQRREMHRRLAGIVAEPELKARHLALAATTGDPATLEALDNAAEMARVRGASTAAAELLELALKLDGDTPQRRIRLAGLDTLAPLLRGLDAAPKATEIFTAAFIADAVEALIAVDRTGDAEPLVDRLERNGTRLDRPWMLAIGARTRAMLLAARGEVDEACAITERAMTEHDRLPMPFERARTELVLGQLQNRQRRKDVALVTLTEALSRFEAMGTRLWAERAAAELARIRFGPRKIAALTPSEQRVADLAAKGMTNRDVAAELFISPKTVEANLSRIYRKLDIHSRAELGRRMREADG